MTRVYNNQRYKERRRFLRKHMTISERVLWEYLRKRRLSGYRFLRQYSIEYFIVDFYCPKLRLAIEVDGGYHHAPDQAVYDAERDAIIRAHGVELMRIRNIDVLNRIDFVLQEIKNRIPSLEHKGGRRVGYDLDCSGLNNSVR